MRALGAVLRPGYQQRHEVVLDPAVAYVELTSATVARGGGVGFVLQCSWNQFRRQLSNRELPQCGAVYFCRDGVTEHSDTESGRRETYALGRKPPPRLSEAAKAEDQDKTAGNRQRRRR